MASKFFADIPDFYGDDGKIRGWKLPGFKPGETPDDYWKIVEGLAKKKGIDLALLKPVEKKFKETYSAIENKKSPLSPALESVDEPLGKLLAEKETKPTGADLAKQAIAAGKEQASKTPEVLPAEPEKGEKCRVWMADNGGEKALIIKSKVDGVTNFTVLNVNAGAEGNEAGAFIKAYAPGGGILDDKGKTMSVEEFNKSLASGSARGVYGSQAQGLAKAFETCKEEDDATPKTATRPPATAASPAQ